MTTINLVASIVAILVGFAFIGFIVREALRGAPERHAEDAAREFYLRNGRWPDEAETGPDR